MKWNSRKKFYPEAVVNTSKFIIEEYIQGEEYAVDAYYDKNGNPVILNIFHHPFFNSKDVSDRIYVMSTDIMIKYMAKFAMLLKEIGDKNNIKNFPLHIELRVTEDERIIPIEVNQCVLPDGAQRMFQNMPGVLMFMNVL